jgi:hypothetical protein
MSKKKLKMINYKFCVKQNNFPSIFSEGLFALVHHEGRRRMPAARCPFHSANT